MFKSSFSFSLHRNTCRRRSITTFLRWVKQTSCCRWRREESTTSQRRRPMSSASRRARYSRSDSHILVGFRSLYPYRCVTMGFSALGDQILSPQDEWYKAEMNGKEGYIPQNYIEMQTPRSVHPSFSFRNLESS